MILNSVAASRPCACVVGGWGGFERSTRGTGVSPVNGAHPRFGRASVYEPGPPVGGNNLSAFSVAEMFDTLKVL